ncbi:MAG TPA: efflux RND transporter periplasmic adaptor subunit, partial [Candidatus Saccharimonadales bacterium]|nr:efflux RND transporter periplasmic adaptor subunit [Candidatus Saccharimonadales bacterium]
MRIQAAGTLCLAAFLAAGCTAAHAVDAQPGGRSPLLRGPFERELLLTGEIEAVRSIAIKAPQTSIFQMRIQFMADEGSIVKAGDPLLGFDNSSLADKVRELETKILDAETQIVARRSELESALKDLEIELAEKQYEHDRAKVEASIDEDVLSRKDYNDRRLAFEKAKKELDDTIERVKKTKKSGQADLDVLTIDRDKLRKDLLSAQKDLELLSIEAPAEGLVVYDKRPQSTLRFQVGDSTWPGQAVIDLPDLSEMQVEFAVNEVDAPLLEPGMKVEITLDAFPGRRLTGEIRRIPSMAVKPDADSDIAIFRVQASLDETWVGEMKPGMSVLGRVVVERRADAALVERKAVRFDGTGYWLDAPAKGDGEPVRIEPIARNASYYVISDEAYA